MRVLHFAPETCFIQRFRELDQITYTTADLSSPEADVHTDITSLAFEDQTFDLVLCSHVLEHIPDDAAAMSELHRVLAEGGQALIQVPDNGSPTTDEDPSVVDPREREARFGQFDHVRVYGRDIVDRLRRAGFEVEVVRLARMLTENQNRRYGLWDDVMYWCWRPVHAEALERSAGRPGDRALGVEVACAPSAEPLDSIGEAAKMMAEPGSER